MEHAYWLDCRQGIPEKFSGDRIYFGHETCPRRLPSPRAAAAHARASRQRGVGLTLVTPPLTEKELSRARALIEAMAEEVDEFEVVCSDWGLLHVMMRQEVPGVPVVGRLLGARPADPRLGRILDLRSRPPRPRELHHLDGTRCVLAYREPSPDLMRHWRGCWLERPSVREFLVSRGVHRCELDNTAQGIAVTNGAGISWSLHVGEVLISTMRRCPGPGEDFGTSPACRSASCSREEIRWHGPDVPVEVFRRDNALYYRGGPCPDLHHAPDVDRLVLRC